MGAEGFLTLSRISDGHVFAPKNLLIEVIEPIVIIPFYARRVGRYLNFDSHHNDYTFLVQQYGDMILIDVIGIGIIPQTSIYSDIWRQWEDSGPGAQSIEKLKKIWAKFIPGFWIPTLYYANGVEDDPHWSLSVEYRNKLKFDIEISWEFWT